MQISPSLKVPSVTATTSALSRTMFFRIGGLAIIASATPLLSVTMHGLIGFLILCALAVAAGIVEGSYTRVVGLVGDTMRKNRLLLLLTAWYLVGLTLNVLTRGNGLDGWRLITGPAVLLIGMCFAFAFLTDAICYRSFQIALIVMWGIQAFLSVRVLFETPGIARQMWTDLGGAWIYGNQSDYATMAVILPVLIWRGFRETRFLRLLLLVFAALILLVLLVCSFATPIGLIGLSVPVIAVLALLSSPGRGRLASIVIVGSIIAMVLILYQFTFGSPLFAESYGRLQNFISDPQSGGYTGAFQVGSRWRLAQISISSFLAEPLFGAGGGSMRLSQYVGNHASALDSLGAYGLLGGGGALNGLILMLLFGATRRLWRERTWESLLALTSVILLLVAGIADPFWEGNQLLLVILMARPFRGVMPKLRKH